MQFEILTYRHTNYIPTLSKDSIFIKFGEIGYINVGVLK